MLDLPTDAGRSRADLEHAGPLAARRPGQDRHDVLGRRGPPMREDGSVSDGLELDGWAKRSWSAYLGGWDDVLVCDDSHERGQDLYLCARCLDTLAAVVADLPALVVDL